MEIDLSPLKEGMDNLFIDFIILLAVPFIAAMIIGFILKQLKVPGKLVGSIVSLLFIFLFILWAMYFL